MQVAVLTSDEYVGTVLPIFLKAFRHHWPDCGWPLVAVGETADADDIPTLLGGINTDDYVVQLCNYLRGCGDDAVMTFRDEWLLYAHQATNTDMVRAYNTLVFDPAVGGVMFHEHEKQELFYGCGFLRELIGLSKGDVLNFPGMWKPQKLLRLIEDDHWPRVLGTYREPFVWSQLMDRGLVRGVCLHGLEMHRSPVRDMFRALVKRYGMREVEDLKIEDSPGVRKSLADVLEKYGGFSNV